jgi:[protein-PII] uridylyltransferase
VTLFREFLQMLFRPNEQLILPAIDWQNFEQQGHSLLSVAMWDVPQLLAKLAGSLAVVPLNILSADIYTRGDNLVLDVLRVCDLRRRAVADARDHSLVAMTLQHALANSSFDFRPLIERARKRIRRVPDREIEFPTRITIDNKAHRSYTLVQIQTTDRVGLLHDLLTAFAAESIAIALSRISTESGAAIDTFYVVDGQTRNKILDNARISKLQQRLRAVAVVG